MKKILLAIGFLFALAIGVQAQTNCVELREIDGTPDVKCVKVIKVTNGTLACTGSTCTLTISGGGGGSPGGSDTSVQYNDSGSFGGVAGFVFDKTSKISLGVAGTSVGAIAFRNATSGTITLQPVTGALGTVTISLPAATGTLLYGGGPLGTPSSGTATNITGLPVSTGISGLGTGVATFLATPSSANFLSAITDETGSGLVIGNNTPTIITPSFTTGFTIGGVAATGTIPRGNGTNFIASTFTMAAPGTSGNVLTSDGTNWVSSAPAGGGITVGTTTITSGTTGRVLYNNAGVVGEMTTSGTGTQLALTAGPTFTGTVAAAALTASSTITQTSNSATAFESGPNGGTNPVFRLVNSTASSATGLSITGNAAGSGVTLTALSSGSNEDITVTPKGTGNFTLVGGSSKFIAPANLNTGGLFFAGDTTTGYSWRTSGTLALVNSGGESMRLTSTSVATFNRTVDFNGANGEQIQNAFINEAKTLATGSTTTTTSANLAPANSIIDAILVRVNTTITTASNFTVKVTGGNNFVMIGTATSSLTTLTAGTTYVLVPAAHADQYNATATTLTITTDVNPGAGALRLSVVYRKLTPPTS